MTAAFLAGCAPGVGYQSPANFPQELRQVVDEALGPMLESHRAAGVAVGIIVGGERFVLGYGSTSLCGGEGVDGETVFEIGSITKTFTGLVLAQMMLEGTLSLDQPANGLLPGATFPDFHGQPITLRHLAAHLSGLPRQPEGVATLPNILNLDPFAHYSDAQLRDWVSGYQLTIAPGTQYLYSNAGYGLLGQILSAHAGLSYTELIAQRITGPLRMQHTSVAPGPAGRSHLADGYAAPFTLGNLTLLVPMPHWDLPGFAGAGAIRSNIGDMLTFISAAMGEDGPLQEAFALETQPFYEIAPTLSVGIAWHAFNAADGGEPIIWHNGATGGFSSFAGFVREARIAVVLLANTSSGMDQPGLQILEALSGRDIVDAAGS